MNSRTAWLALPLAALAGLIVLLLLQDSSDGVARVVDAGDTAPRPEREAPSLAPVVAGGRSESGSTAVDLFARDLEVRVGVRLAGPGRLEGRVVDRETGGGVVGARVELLTEPPTGRDMLGRVYALAKFQDNWQRRLAPVATARSGAGGNFAFTGVRNGTYFLEARGGRYTPDQPVLVRVDSDGAGGPAEVRVRAAGRVVGRVVTEDARPVSGAEVVVYPGLNHFLTAARDGDFRMLSAKTERDGRFVIHGVPPGPGYFASASGAGLCLSHIDQPFDVWAGEDAEIELVGRVGGVIRGQVLARRLDADGGEVLEPVAGAHVGALPRGLLDMRMLEEVLEATHAVTDAEGNYVIRNAPGGEVDVGAAAAGLVPAKSAAVVVSEGVEARAQPIVLASGSQLALRFLDADGAPVPDVQLSWFVTDFDALQYETTLTPLLLQAIEGFEFPVSDADGLAVAGPFPGNPPHRLVCWRSGYEMREIAWDPDVDGEEMDVVLDSGGVVEGIVMDLERAEPVTRFEIRSRRLLDWEPEGPTNINPFAGSRWVEDPNGRFRLEAVSDESRKLTFSAPGYLAERVEIDVQPGESTRGVIVKLRRGGTVRGRVLNPQGEPIVGAQVAAMDDRGRSRLGRGRSPRASTDSAKEFIGQEIAMRSLDMFAGLGALGAGYAVTDADGAFELTGLPEGPAFLHATHREYADGRSPEIDVSAGEPLTGVDLTLTAGASIFGTVTDRFGLPVQDALLVAMSTELMANTDPSARWVRQGATDAQGAYRISRLEPGGYFVACTRGDAELNPASFLGTLNFDLVTVAPDAEVRHDLIDSSAAAVRVYGVVRAEGEPVDGGGVFAVGFESEKVLGVDLKVAQVGADGTFEFEGLAPGEYSFSWQGSGPPVQMQVEIPDAPEHRLVLDLPGGRISGIVRDAVSGEPIQYAQLALLRAEHSGSGGGGLLAAVIERESRAARNWSSRKGTFVFPRLEEGVYELKVDPPRWGDSGGAWAPAEPREVEVIEGVRTEIEILLQPSLSLTGVVLDGGGAPVRGARIFAFSHSDREIRPATARSGENGEFALRGLAEGDYDVSATADGFAQGKAVTASVSVEPRDPLVLELVRGVDVVLHVRDALGMPLQGATARLWPITGSGKSPTPRIDDAIQGIFRGEGLSDDAGRLELGRHTPGEYRLEVARGTLSSTRERIVLEEGPPLELEVELQ